MKLNFIKYKTVFWDFNGTLINDFGASLNSVNDMLQKRDMPIITAEQYYSFVDTPISKFYENLFDLNVVTFDIIATEFHEGYNKHIAKKPLMPGVLPLLEAFKKTGASQIVLSSAHLNNITPKLKETGIVPYFDDVLGQTNLTADDKTEIARQYVKDNRLSPKKCLVIGDTLHDYHSTVAIGCDCILITKGHQSRLQFAAAPNAIIIDDFAELL
ncbi:MAG: HAD family hydrolase [Oscillospiraceae bacterium]|nr:HAD family hydrolase [Oscillospiraceae bacterium]